jgi:hypothetical protein
MGNPGETVSPDSPALPGVSLTPLPSEAQVEWKPSDLAVFIGFVVLAFLLTDFLVLAGYFGLKAARGWRVSLTAVEQNPFFLVVFQTVFYALLLGFIYLLVVVNHRWPFWKALKWRPPVQARRVQFLLGGVLLAFATRYTPTLLPERDSFPLERLFSSPSSAYAVAAFAVFIAPFMEELVFRGVLFSMFDSLLGLRFAIVTTTLLFAGLHVPEYWGAWHHVLMIALVGFAFSLGRGLTGSLATSYILHLAYNATLIAFLFFETQRFQTIQGLILPG